MIFDIRIFILSLFCLSFFSLLRRYARPLCVHTVKPVKVKIVSANDILTAGIKSPLRCEAWGSSPPGTFYLNFSLSLSAHNCTLYMAACGSQLHEQWALNGVRTHRRAKNDQYSNTMALNGRKKCGQKLTVKNDGNITGGNCLCVCEFSARAVRRTKNENTFRNFWRACY